MRENELISELKAFVTKVFGIPPFQEMFTLPKTVSISRQKWFHPKSTYPTVWAWSPSMIQMLLSNNELIPRKSEPVSVSRVKILDDSCCMLFSEAQRMNSFKMGSKITLLKQRIYHFSSKTFLNSDFSWHEELSIAKNFVFSKVTTLTATVGNMKTNQIRRKSIFHIWQASLVTSCGLLNGIQWVLYEQIWAMKHAVKHHW